MKEKTAVNENVKESSSPRNTETNVNQIGQDYEMKHKKENHQIRDSRYGYASSTEITTIMERNNAVTDVIIEDMNQELRTLTSNDSCEVE